MRQLEGELRRYRWTNRVLFVGMIFYLVIAANRERVAGQEELFPFASWSLFTLVPNTTRDYSLRITEVDHQPLKPPVFFEDARQYFGSVSHNSARMTIQRLGTALELHDVAATEEVRGYLEALYLNQHNSVCYEVVARTYDVLERWDTSAFREIHMLARFVAQRPASAESLPRAPGQPNRAAGEIR